MCGAQSAQDYRRCQFQTSCVSLWLHMLNVACTVFMICTPIKAKNATHWSYGPPDYGRLSNRRRPTSSNWQTREPSHGRPQEDAEALEQSALAARSEVGGCRRCESRA